MTSISVETIEVLNDLIEINNDRIQAYRRAVRDLNEADLDISSFFQDMINESLRNNSLLSREVSLLGGEAETGTSLEGKIYRAWMTVKNVLKGRSRFQVLENCEMTEDASIDAYRAALQVEDMPGFLREMISDQLDSLLYAHDLVRKRRHQAVFQ